MPLDLCNAGAAVIGDTIYVAGGFAYSSWSLVDTLFKYSISSNTWTGAPGHHGGNYWSPEVVALKGKLYYIGGNPTTGGDAPSRQTWVYTPGMGWALGDSLNVGRVFTQAVVYHDTIWVAGGVTTDTTVTPSTEFFDPVTGQWIENPGFFPSMPTGIWGAAQGVAQDKFVIFSGIQPDWNLFGYCQYFNFVTRSWEALEAVSAPRYRNDGCGFLDRAVFALGGSSGGFTPTDIVQYKNLGPSPDAAVLSIIDPKFPTYPANHVVSTTIRVANLGNASA